MNKRIFVESTILCVLLLLGYYGWQVLNGMLLTLNDTPDVIETYTSVETLEEKVSFGTSHGSSSIYGLLGCFGLSVMYYGIRIAILRLRKRT
ncbi:hypothetical protein [Paenibacillus guangzhouensis]|uniref:hypothetical protein n=1 Tax=Paenibacillus guangzhouensis TaxID=1473112 RepID=UPI001266CDB5|nr:hypothetical protein [Paenibacillus guangzhouensis]